MAGKSKLGRDGMGKKSMKRERKGRFSSRPLLLWRGLEALTRIAV